MWSEEMMKEKENRKNHGFQNQTRPIGHGFGLVRLIESPKGWINDWTSWTDDRTGWTGGRTGWTDDRIGWTDGWNRTNRSIQFLFLFLS